MIRGLLRSRFARSVRRGGRESRPFERLIIDHMKRYRSAAMDMVIVNWPTGLAIVPLDAELGFVLSIFLFTFFYKVVN